MTCVFARPLSKFAVVTQFVAVTQRTRGTRALSAALVPALLVLGAGCSGDSSTERDGGTQALPNQPAPVTTPAPSAAPDPENAAPGSGTVLRVSESWVDLASNGLGIQGSFFTYQDGSGRTTIAADATRTQTGYCVSGSSAEVLNGDFSGTWGAVAALNLAQLPGTERAEAYDAVAHGVVGFGFDIVGNTGGALRFVVKEWATHDGFCINNVPDCAEGCSAEYRVDALTQNCWTPGGRVPVATALSALEWQIVPKEGSPTAFDYCIENIHAVLDPSAAPAAAPAPAPADEDEGPAPYAPY